MVLNRIFRSWKRLQQSQKRYILLFFLSGAGLFIHYHKEALLNYEVDNVARSRNSRQRLPPTDDPEDLIPPGSIDTIHHNAKINHEPNPDNDDDNREEIDTGNNVISENYDYDGNKINDLKTADIESQNIEPENEWKVASVNENLENSDNAKDSENNQSHDKSAKSKFSDFEPDYQAKNLKELAADIKPKPGIAGTWRDETAEFTPEQKEIVSEFKYAWAAYKKSAWGKDTLKPISKSYDTWFDMGLTLLDSLDNLIIFKMDEEFEEAKNWVRDSLSFDQDIDYVNLFECTIRVLGGLLSAFTLSAEPIFKDKAIDIGDRLLNAFSGSKTDVPLSDINPYRKRARPPKWGSDSSTSEVTTVQLEFRELAVVTNEHRYSEPVLKTSKHVSELVNSQKDHHFVQMFINPHSGKMKSGGTITFGARTDSYYEYLLKQWIQSNGDSRDDYLLNDYLKAMIDMRDKLITVTKGKERLTFVAELQGSSRMHPKMDHLVCFLPGTLALGHWWAKEVHLRADVIPEWHLDLARELARTCHYMYSFESGLAPEIVYFDISENSNREIYVKPADSFSILRPEAVECWFYLYRVTGDQKYRDWGWEFFKNLQKHAKLPNGNGFASLESVTTTHVKHRDKMESFFLAETMKYLFLLFSDDKELLPLDKFVFNTEAHPLLVRTGNNEKMFSHI